MYIKNDCPVYYNTKMAKENIICKLKKGAKIVVGGKLKYVFYIRYSNSNVKISGYVDVDNITENAVKKDESKNIKITHRTKLSIKLRQKESQASKVAATFIKHGVGVEIVKVKNDSSLVRWTSDTAEVEGWCKTFILIEANKYDIIKESIEINEARNENEQEEEIVSKNPKKTKNANKEHVQKITAKGLRKKICRLAKKKNGRQLVREYKAVLCRFPLIVSGSGKTSFCPNKDKNGRDGVTIWIDGLSRKKSPIAISGWVKSSYKKKEIGKKAKNRSFSARVTSISVNYIHGNKITSIYIKCGEFDKVSGIK